MKIGMSFAEWEAELNTDCCDPYNNAELTLTLKLGFRQINPANGAAEGTYHDYGDNTRTERKIVKWSSEAWASWKHNFCTSAQAFWHGKFWLINNFAEYHFTVRGTEYRPNIWCRFRLVGGDADQGAHNHIIEVVRLHRSETWFGSHSTLYDSLDTNSVQKATDSAGKPIKQRAHVHEVGHLLGLDHVDVGQPHCPASGDTNATQCYGMSDYSMNSVMGSGMQLRLEHAAPWRKAMIALSGRGSIGTATDWEAKMRRHYPRTMAEVASNAAITATPVRR